MVKFRYLSIGVRITNSVIDQANKAELIVIILFNILNESFIWYRLQIVSYIQMYTSSTVI